MCQPVFQDVFYFRISGNFGSGCETMLLWKQKHSPDMSSRA
ncbi:MAG: hypothetical protein JWP12_3564 [Bacteroidetes bacterium]|nr:hypothetical protein [Bacteroidota bacterium]